MTLTVAGVKKEYETGLKVSKLIEIEKVEMPIYVSVSINDEFIPSDTFETHTLNDGDSVEFLYFMGGGQNYVYK